MNREIFFILLALLLTPPVSASIGWNGEYWLIGWGGANNPEMSQSREIDLVKFDKGNYSFLWIGKPASIGKITWAEDYWLIVVHPQPRPEIALLKYNDTITKLPIDWMHLNSMVWNGEYFLLGGTIAKEGAWVPVIFKYDGISVVELPFPFTEVISPREPSYVSAIGWNGDYWLISESVGRGLNRPVPTERLVKYDGNFTDFGELNFTNINHIIWNGDYWLIGGNEIFDKSTEAKLVKYDGKTFTELSPPLNVGSIITLVWNGKYWLIGGSSRGVLIKYDGTAFTNLKAQAGLSNDEYVISTVWNGEYWLIATGKTEPYGRRLVKYDGSSFTDLTSNLGNPITIGDMVWNGEYWLIESYIPRDSKPGQKYMLIKYDGKAFVDLTPRIEAALRPSPTLASKVPTETNVSMPTVSQPKPEELPTNYKNIVFVLAAVLLVALTLYLLWKKKKSK